MMGILFFVLIFNMAFGDTFEDSIHSIKKQVEELNKGIEESHKNISKIKIQETSILDQINRIEKDLIKIRAEHAQLQEEYNQLKKKTEYGEKNLKLSSQEIKLREEEYRQKLLAWQKIRDENLLSGKNEEFLKADLRNLLIEDERRINSIRDVHNEIRVKKTLLESEKEQLGLLKNRLRLKQNEINKKIIEKNTLISKLKSEEKYYKNRIVSLNMERDKMEKEIEKIIKERAKAMKGNVSIYTAKKYIGSLVKPLLGNTVVYFGETTIGDVKSLGIEINSPIGSLVKSAASGEVIYAGKFGSLGKMVMIDHGYNLITIYGNLISTSVKVGDDVDKNEKIGILGLSKDGKSNLYFETRFNLKSENPSIFF